MKSLTFDRIASEVFTTRIILPPTPPPPPPPRPPNMSPHPRPLTPTDTPPPLVLGPLPVARAVVGRCSPDRPPTPPAASRLDPTPTHASPIATAQPPLVTPRPKSPPPPTPSPPEMARSPQSRPSRPRMPQSPLPPSPKAFGDVNPRELKAQAARWSPSPGASLGPKVHLCGGYVELLQEGCRWELIRVHAGRISVVIAACGYTSIFPTPPDSQSSD